MLACFSGSKVLGLDGSAKRRKLATGDARGVTVSPEEEDALYAQLGRLSETFPKRHQALIEEVLLGGGANGIAYMEGPRVSVAIEGDVAVFFQGEVFNLCRKGKAESPADAILKQYIDGEWTHDKGGDKLGQLDGTFAVIVFDKLCGRVMVARDPSGAEPLYWGTGQFGEMMMFCNDKDLLESECADADAFPAGTYFCSSPGEITGELTILPEQPFDESDESEDISEHDQSGDHQHDVPTDEGCGKIIARVASQQALSDLHRIGSSHEITASFCC